ncbi:MAG TPA: hypothetical protein VGQ30_02305, partial [Gemmatimonadaceae bacterium]|nr:hypothetical protein [Gemmatimonadaceae bacterium]
VAAVRKSLFLVIFLGAVILAEATKNFMVLVYTELATAGGVAVVTVHAAHQSLPDPPDSTRAAHALRSPEMWDRYVSGYREGMELRRESAVKEGYVATGVTVLAAGLTYLLFQLMKGIFTHIS